MDKQRIPSARRYLLSKRIEIGHQSEMVMMMMMIKASSFEWYLHKCKTSFRDRRSSAQTNRAVVISVFVCARDVVMVLHLPIGKQPTHHVPYSIAMQRVYNNYNHYWVMLACVSHIKCKTRCKFASFMCWTFWRDGNVILVTLGTAAATRYTKIHHVNT